LHNREPTHTVSRLTCCRRRHCCFCCCCCYLLFGRLTNNPLVHLSPRTQGRVEEISPPISWKSATELAWLKPAPGHTRTERVQPGSLATPRSLHPYEQMEAPESFVGGPVWWRLLLLRRPARAHS